MSPSNEWKKESGETDVWRQVRLQQKESCVIQAFASLNDQTAYATMRLILVATIEKALKLAEAKDGRLEHNVEEENQSEVRD